MNSPKGWMASTVAGLPARSLGPEQADSKGGATARGSHAGGMLGSGDGS